MQPPLFKAAAAGTSAAAGNLAIEATGSSPCVSDASHDQGKPDTPRIAMRNYQRLPTAAASTISLLPAASADATAHLRGRRQVQVPRSLRCRRRILSISCAPQEQAQERVHLPRLHGRGNPLPVAGSSLRAHQKPRRILARQMRDARIIVVNTYLHSSGPELVIRSARSLFLPLLGTP